jgi:hypothetical protein
MKLGEIGGGALQERFEMEFDKVMENIMDRNTDYKPVRKVTLTVAIKTNEDRTVAEMSYSVKSTVAAPKTLTTNVLFDRDPDTGKPIAREFGKQIPGQQAMVIDNVTPIKAKEM